MQESYEKDFYLKNPKILKILLKDNTTNNNIIWATNSYKRKGIQYKDCIIKENIVEKRLIVPRIQKIKKEQYHRSKKNAEVFTPSWICNKQNNIIDTIWFGKENVFNYEKENGWITNKNIIEFPKDKSWKDYVKNTRLEISCGEAPYIVSRYDTVTGNKIEIKDRIGLLDRKFRIINENCTEIKEWLNASIEAIKSIYGFELQGDNLFLARENILFSFIDYYYYKFKEDIDEKVLNEVAKIISWNIWQMDGIKNVVPDTCEKYQIEQLNFFGEKDIIESECTGCINGDIHSHNGIYAKVMDWNTKKKIRFVDLITGGI